MKVSAQLYLVTGAISELRLEAALAGGVDLVQLRMKDASDELILAQAARMRAILDPHGVPLIINDRPDLAAAAGAGGVHVGQDDQAVVEARSIVGSDAIVGLSTHSRAQIDAACELELDYFAVGPIYATPTKPGRAPVGLELIRYAAARAEVPFFAIGGIDAATLAGVIAAGADRVAVVRAIADAPDPRRAAAGLAGALRREVEPA